MLVVGLTGNLGSGKTTVLNLLQRKGARVFNSDRCVHQLYNQKKGLVYKKIACQFPEAVNKGRINRGLLSNFVFADKNKLKKLEQIVHPVVIKELGRWIKDCRRRTKSGKVCLAEVPLLFEKRLKAYFDLVVLVKTEKKVLVKRLGKLYGFSKQQAYRRLSFYKPLREKTKGADYIVDNSGNFMNLKKEVDLLWKKLKEK